MRSTTSEVSRTCWADSSGFCLIPLGGRRRCQITSSQKSNFASKTESGPDRLNSALNEVSQYLFTMSVTSQQASSNGCLRERHVAPTTTSQKDAENAMDRMDEHLNGSAQKEKKTFGRTPGGTGKQFNSCETRLLSIEGNSMPLFHPCQLDVDAYHL